MKPDMKLHMKPIDSPPNRPPLGPRARKEAQPIDPHQKIKPKAAGSRSVGRPRTIPQSMRDMADRLRALGHTKKDTAAITGLTLQQVHYLWYIVPRNAAAREERSGQPPAVTRPPLRDIAPEPIRAGHKHAMPNHKWCGHRTSFRSDVIRQVKACQGKRYKLHEVGSYFNLPSSSIHYIWYQLPNEELDTNPKHE